MISNERLGRLAQQIGERLQDASHAPEEIQRSVQSVMRGAFDRMELVSREDFDILMDVLQRTRMRVEALERQVAALEAAVDTQSATPASPAVVAADMVTPPSGRDVADSTLPSEDAGAGEVGDSDISGTPRDADDKTP
ncbi:MAG: accessory factor UbiK family protein [Halomonas sp.]|nr:accessory factor UbiK family protein [Halomonas sp.]